MSEFYAVVAEYRNVAILEKNGDKPRFWQGKQYFTDGLAHLFLMTPNKEEIQGIQFKSERDAKNFIDSVLDSPNSLHEHLQKIAVTPHDFTMVPNFAESLKDSLMNYREAYQLIMRKPYKGKVPTYAFDEKSGAFVLVTGVADGQHRHKGWGR